MAAPGRKDKYNAMTALLADRVEGRDYAIECRSGSTDVVVLAPHGGRIEPTTSTIAREIAGREHGLYCFEGLLDENSFDELHVTAIHYDEPQCLALVTKAHFAVAIHGLRRGETVDVGGLNDRLQEAIAHRLGKAGFPARVDHNSDHAGRDAANICNRGRSPGAQIEIPMRLRDQLRDDGQQLSAFAAAVRAAIAREA